MYTVGGWAVRIGVALALLGVAGGVIAVFGFHRPGMPCAFHIEFLGPGDSCPDRTTLYIDQTSGDELHCAAVGGNYIDPYVGG